MDQSTFGNIIDRYMSRLNWSTVMGISLARGSPSISLICWTRSLPNASIPSSLQFVSSLSRCIRIRPCHPLHHKPLIEGHGNHWTTTCLWSHAFLYRSSKPANEPSASRNSSQYRENRAITLASTSSIEISVVASLDNEHTGPYLRMLRPQPVIALNRRNSKGGFSLTNDNSIS